MNENPVGGEVLAQGSGEGAAFSAPGVSDDWRAALPEDWADRLGGVESREEAMAALERGLAYRPAASPEDISLTFPENFTGRVDEGVQKGFCELCVREGITPSQAQALLDWQLGADRQMSEKLVEDGTRVLKKEWGSRFSENRSTALRAFSALDRRMGGALSASSAGRGMANDPAFVRAFYEVGRMISEDRLSTGALFGAADLRESAEETYNGMFRGE